MKQAKIKVGILPNQFLKSNGQFNKTEATKLFRIYYDKEKTHIIAQPNIIQQTILKYNCKFNKRKTLLGRV